MVKLSTEFYTVTEDTIFIAYAKKGLVKITYDPLKSKDKSYLVTGVNFQDAKNSIAIILREPEFVKMKMFAEGYVNDPTGKSFEGQYGAQIAFSKYNNEIKTFSMKAAPDNNPSNKLEMTILLNFKQGNNLISIPIDYYTLISIIYMADNVLHNRYETTNSLVRAVARLADSIPNNIAFDIFNAVEQKMQAYKNYNMDNDANTPQNTFDNQPATFGNPINNQQTTFGNPVGNQQTTFGNPVGNQQGNPFSSQPSGNNTNIFASNQGFNKSSVPPFGARSNNNLNPDLNNG